MPLAPIAALVAPKAGVAVATAMAMGPDEFAHHIDGMAHHMGDLAHQVQDHASAFISLPIPKSRIFDIVVGPEIAAYHWAHAKIAGLLDSMGIHQNVPDQEQGRMVEYFAGGCPHCKHIEPIWKDATGLWDKEGGDHHVAWQQKECLDNNWKPGADYKECQAANVARFPTIRFFAPGAKTGEDFFLDRTPEKLVDFAKTGMAPDPMVMPRAHADVSDMKLVDFYAAACPHCKTLDPVWEAAHKQWDKTIGQEHGAAPRDDLPFISFDKKECYDSHWHAGKDNAECQKFQVDGFPTIKLFVPDPHGHGFKGIDYTGDRTADGIVNFLKAQTGMTEAEAAKSAIADASAHAAPAADAAAHAELATGHHDAPAHATPPPVAPMQGVKVPDALKAQVMAAGANVPASVKAAAAAAEQHRAMDLSEKNLLMGEAEVAHAEKDLLALQGNTPSVTIEGGADDKYHVEVKIENPDEAPAPAGGEKLTESLTESVKTAMMPLQVLSCMPVRKPRAAPVSSQKAPPAARKHFI